MGKSGKGLWKRIRRMREEMRQIRGRVGEMGEDMREGKSRDGERQEKR